MTTTRDAIGLARCTASPVALQSFAVSNADLPLATTGCAVLARRAHLPGQIDTAQRRPIDQRHGRRHQTDEDQEGEQRGKIQCLSR